MLALLSLRSFAPLAEATTSLSAVKQMAGLASTRIASTTGAAATAAAAASACARQYSSLTPSSSVVSHGQMAATVSAAAAAPLSTFASRALHTTAAPHKHLQSLLTVEVKNNNVDAALRQLSNKIRNDNLHKEWRARGVYLKPSEERVIARKETAKRLRKREFKQRLRWIVSRKSRGF